MLARNLGISRSEFFTKAAERWADELERDDTTNLINAVVDDLAEGENAEFLRTAARRAIARDPGRRRH